MSIKNLYLVLVDDRRLMRVQYPLHRVAWEHSYWLNAKILRSDQIDRRTSKRIESSDCPIT